MEGRVKLFSALALLFLVLIVAVFAVPGLLKIARGFIQYFLSGNSSGKLIFTMASLVFLPLFCIFSIKANVQKKLGKIQKKLFFAFVILAGLFFILGILQFAVFSSGYDASTSTAFATLLSDGDYINWESSLLSHNHFPKITVYLLEKTFGMNPGQNFDDGRPFFEIFPHAELWGIAFTILLLAIIAAGLLHLASIAGKIKVFDFLVFSILMVGVIIHGLDGGFGEATTTITVFLILLYWFRNYSGIENSWKNILPLAFFGLFVLIVRAFSQTIAVNALLNLSIILIGLLYYFVKEFREKKLLNNLGVNSIFALAFLIILFQNYIAVSVMINGSWVYDFSAESKTEIKLEKGAGLFVYGIPDDVSNELLKDEISKFGEILEFDRVDWVLYARIVPKQAFMAGELEDGLVKRIKPKKYFYVEGFMPSANSTEFKLFLRDNNKINLDSQFLGITIADQKFDEKTNSITILTKGKYPASWQMLAILTEAKNKGANKQALIEIEG
ncbi:MAG: RNA-binding protein [Candidatus Diapherotrites archaeon]|nr:RNA-binding protein [Candidatus Diapherotrites archaeon]